VMILRLRDANLRTVLSGDQVLANSLILLPIAGLVLAAASGLILRARQERGDKQARELFKIGQ